VNGLGCTDAAVALVAIVNPLHDSIVPSANQLSSLVALSLRSPKSQGSAQHWGAEHAKGSEDLTNNTRLAIYGAALQLVAEDLIGKKHKVRAWLYSDAVIAFLVAGCLDAGFTNASLGAEHAKSSEGLTSSTRRVFYRAALQLVA
jgi:hypothetical protein